MHKTPLALRAAPIALLALLAACNSKAAGDENADTANQTTAAPPVTLPPALLASRTYRCKDNSLIYVDFLDDNKTANLKTGKESPIIHLSATEAGKPFEGEGYKVVGSGTEITYQAPGKGSESCKA